MKKIFLLIALSFLALGASAQHYGYSGHQRHQAPYRQAPHHQAPAYGHNLRPEVACLHDWQNLWNGCHVRLKGGKVYVYERDGDRVVYGDEIILLPTGFYKVRKGYDWRIYEEDGDWTSIHGEQIVNFWNGCYCALSGGVWRVYDYDGDRLGVWSQHRIELLWNGFYKYERSGRYYVADQKGDRIFNIWGDEVHLREDGIFQVRRGSYYRYYDLRGNELR